MQPKTVALRERGRLAALVHQLWHEARQQPGWRDPDRRNTRTWQAVRLGVVVACSTRLVALRQVILVGGTRAAQPTKRAGHGRPSPRKPWPWGWATGWRRRPLPPGR